MESQQRCFSYPCLYIHVLFLQFIGVGSFYWFDKFVNDVEDVQLSYSVVPIVVSLPFAIVYRRLPLFTSACNCFPGTAYGGLLDSLAFPTSYIIHLF